MNRLKITFLLTCLTLLLVAMASAIAGLAMAIIAPMTAMLIQMSMSRFRTNLADASGASICGNPLALANPLRKLQQAATLLPMRAATLAAP